MSSVVLLFLSFAIVLSGATLFVNAIEWLGHKLELGEGAVGSLLAAVATALPESLVPIVALVGGSSRAEGVSTGAIIGAPLLLTTLAMALVGSSAFLFRRQRPQRLAVDAHIPTVAGDLAVFLACFSVVLALGLIGASQELRVAGAMLLVVAYAAYVRRTLRHGGARQMPEKLDPLHFDRTRTDPPTMAAVVMQLLVALAAIIGGAHMFVENLIDLAEAAGVQPLVLSLVLTPFATELPEKLNSFLWIRSGDDSLALGNITGALVFQSTIPVGIGLSFTSWELDRHAAVAGVLALAGGVVALLTLALRRRFTLRAVAAWAGLYAVFVGYATASA